MMQFREGNHQLVDGHYTTTREPVAKTQSVNVKRTATSLSGNQRSHIPSLTTVTFVVTLTVSLASFAPASLVVRVVRLKLDFLESCKTSWISSSPNLPASTCAREVALWP
jgi:hypothetical protein